MTSVEVRTALEKELLEKLKQAASPHATVKASKNKLGLFVSKQKCGEIYVQHLRNADGYYAGLEIYACEALDFCVGQSPPYPSRLLNSSFLSKISLSEATKQFGDESGGTIRTPAPEAIRATATKIYARLLEFYLPAAENGLLGTPSLIDDVVAAPDNYAYPFLTALFVARKNNLGMDSVPFKKVLGTKAIFGNKQFDLALASRILEADGA